MSIAFSTIFIGVMLLASVFGPIATLRRIGERGPSCALLGVTGVVGAILSLLALLPSVYAPMPTAAMWPLLVVVAALCVGWATDTVSTRLPHVTSSTALMAVSAAAFLGWAEVTNNWQTSTWAVTFLAVAPVVAGAVIRPPDTLVVLCWYGAAMAAVVASALSSLILADQVSWIWTGPSAVMAVTLFVLLAGWLAVRFGQMGGGDPGWLAFCVMAAASHVLLSVDGTMVGLAALAMSVLGAAMFLAISSASALMLTGVSYIYSQVFASNGGSVGSAGQDESTHRTVRPLLAGQWATVGLLVFVVVWKFTPLGANMIDMWGVWAS